jgi:hypothetical protein
MSDDGSTIQATMIGVQASIDVAYKYGLTREQVHKMVDLAWTAKDVGGLSEALRIMRALDWETP